MIVVGTVIAVPDPVRLRTAAAWRCCGVMLGCAAIGLLDDWRSVIRRRSLGLRGRYKLLGQLLVSILLCAVADDRASRPRSSCRSSTCTSTSGPFWYVLVFLIVVGASNAVNLTDGLDGLAAGTTSIAMLAYTAMTVIGYQVGQRLMVDPDTPLSDLIGLPKLNAETLDLAILAAACSGPASGSSGTTPTRPRSSWATPARWPWAARVAGVRRLHQDRAAAAADRRRLRDRGAERDHPGGVASSASAGACSAWRRSTTTSR